MNHSPTTWKEECGMLREKNFILQHQLTGTEQKLAIAVEALGGLVHHCVDFNQGEESFVLAMEIERAREALKKIKEAGNGPN